MGVPNHWACDYSYLGFALTDVADVVTNFATQAVAMGWTLDGSYYKSPPDSMGRFCEVDLSSVGGGGGLQLEANVYDQNVVLIGTRRAYITAPAYCHMFVGPYYFHVDLMSGGGNEYVRGGILDIYPIVSSPYADYTYMWGSRTSGGSLTTDQFVYLILGDSATTLFRQSSLKYLKLAEIGLDGSYLGKPCFVNAYPPVGASPVRQGRLFQHVAISDTNKPYFSRVVIPIATGILGTFQITCMPYYTSTGAANARIGIRVA